MVYDGVVVGFQPVPGIADYQIAPEFVAAGEIEAYAGIDVGSSLVVVVRHVVESHAAAEVEETYRRRRPEAGAEYCVDREETSAIADVHIYPGADSGDIDCASLVTEEGVDVYG